MFVSPMIGALPSDFYDRPKRYSAIRPDTGSRLSTVSSDNSSLHRTSSIASSASTSASSVASAETKRRPQHRKALSGSFTLPRALQPFHKKALSQSLSQSPSRSPSQSLPQSPKQLPSSPLPPPPPPPTQQQQQEQKPLKQQPQHQKLSKQQPQQQKLSKQQPQQQELPRQPPPRPKRPSQEAQRWSELAMTLPTMRPSTTQWQCSDLVVRCKDDVYHVDRTIMCYHSRWFARICAIMKTPKAKSIIDLSADDPDAVSAMMQYCYQLDYTHSSLDAHPTIDHLPDLRPHVHIYMLAERYGVAGLKQLALQKFKALATTVLAVNGNDEQLLQAVRALYEPGRRANADELRRVAVGICADHVEGFIEGSRGSMALVFESMDTLPEFRAELFEEMAVRWK